MKNLTRQGSRVIAPRACWSFPRNHFPSRFHYITIYIHFGKYTSRYTCFAVARHFSLLRISYEYPKCIYRRVYTCSLRRMYIHSHRPARARCIHYSVECTSNSSSSDAVWKITRNTARVCNLLWWFFFVLRAWSLRSFIGGDSPFFSP